MYYWDTYFSMLGIQIAGRKDLLLALVKNFSSIIDRYGFIPNGCRTYYLSRSHPPLLVLMLEMLEQEFGTDTISPFLPALKREYEFFMTTRSVKLPNGASLNRYWDAKNTPREESYLEDVELIHVNPDHLTLGRELRAAAESGWDFSSRWFGNSGLGSIHTTDFAPIDLNCILYHLEMQLGIWLEDTSYTQAAQTRKTTILEHCWDETQGWFFDLEHQTGVRSQSWTLAGMFPLYFRLATPAQAMGCAKRLGAPAMDFLPGTRALRLSRPRPRDCQAFCANCRASLATHRALDGKVQRRRHATRGWRWRVPRARRVWLDERCGSRHDRTLRFAFESIENLKCLIVVEAKTVRQGKSSFERRYFLSSKDWTAEETLEGVRGHWSIEREQPASDAAR
jgi:predicted transposase YbfD/YdcC